MGFLGFKNLKILRDLLIQIKTYYIIIVGPFFSSRSRVSLVAFWLFLLSDGTPLSSAHAYKAEGGGRILRCETAKKAKRLQGTPLA